MPKESVLSIADKEAIKIEKLIFHIILTDDINPIFLEEVKITDEQLIEWKRYYQVITHKLDGDNIPYISGKEDTHPLDVLYDHLWRGRQK